VTFADLLAGEAVFLDANTFLYHLATDPVLGPPQGLGILLTRMKRHHFPE
jgi:hypothetical protein